MSAAEHSLTCPAPDSPPGDRYLMTPGNRLLARVTALLMATTACLKVLLLLKLPVTTAAGDPVLDFLTEREVLILAVMFEVVLATLLWRAKDARFAAMVLCYFATCGTIYHLALALPGGPEHCSCLGVAEDWLGPAAATWGARAILLACWIVGWVMSRSAGSDVRSRAFCVPAFTVICTAFSLALSASAAQVGLVGISLETSYGRTGIPQRTISNVIHVTVDLHTHTSMYVPSVLPHMMSPGLEFGTNYVYASTGTVASFVLSPGEATAVLEDSERVWRLGLVGGGVETRVFRALRCVELFPDHAATKTRALSPVGIRGPLSEMCEAAYEWKGHDHEQELTCELRTSRKLMDAWQHKLRRAPPIDRNFRRELEAESAQFIRRFPPGFLVETTRFSAFTNLAGLDLPLALTLRRYGQAATNLAGQGSLPYLAGESTLRFEVIRRSADPLAYRPVPGTPSLSIAETRLQDEGLGIASVEYRTNVLASLAVSPVAQQRFSERQAERRAAALRKRLQRAMGAVLIFTLGLGPVLYWMRGGFREQADVTRRMLRAQPGSQL